MTNGQALMIMKADAAEWRSVGSALMGDRLSGVD